MKFGQYAVSGIAALGLLSGCGGGGLDAAPDNTPTVAAALTAANQAGRVANATEARNAANTVLPLLVAADTRLAAPTSAKSEAPINLRGPVAVGLARAVQPAAEPKAQTNCPNGGTKTDSLQSESVGSPYTSDPNRLFSLTVLREANCKTVSQANGVTDTVTENGLSKDGEVSENNRRIAYRQVGESVATPLRRAEEIQYSENGRSYTDTVLLELFAVAHQRADSAGNLLDAESFVSTRGQLNGFDSGNAYSGAFAIQQGVSNSLGNRYVVSVTDTGALTATGAVSVGVITKPASLGANCGSGSFTVATPVPLLSNGSVLQGELRITGNGQTARYVFSSNGQVVITAGDGSSQTLSQASLGDCGF